MKGRSIPRQQLRNRDQSCYQRHSKHSFDYTTLYAKAPHLRQPLQKGRVGPYAPHVNNLFYDWRADRVTSD